MAADDYVEQQTPQTMTHEENDSQGEQTMSLPNEEQPLLSSDPAIDWKPPPAFLWIQFGAYMVFSPTRHGLTMLDHSNHVERLPLWL